VTTGWSGNPKTGTPAALVAHGGRKTDGPLGPPVPVFFFIGARPLSPESSPCGKLFDPPSNGIPAPKQASGGFSD